MPRLRILLRMEMHSFVKVCNLDEDMMSDIDVICFEVSEGGLVRTA